MLPVPEDVGLLIPGFAWRVHEKLDTETGIELIGVYENNIPLQIVGGFVLSKVGNGLTITVTVVVFEHPLASVPTTV